MTENLIDDLAELQFNLKDAGLSVGSIERLTRFIRLNFSTDCGKKELKRWEETGLIKNGKIVITKNDLENLTTINFCLWDAVYCDELQFISPDQYSISEWKKREIEESLRREP